MRLTKLDNRHTGHNNFQYLIDFTYNDQQRFADQRAWCWETWGPSVELPFYNKVRPVNTHWAWAHNNYAVRLYLGGQHEASHYLLRWGDN